MLTAVQIGAGGIGRGFLGQLLFEGGYETIFVEADEALVERLNARGEYPVRLVSDTASETRNIGRLSALSVTDTKAVVEAIAQADLVSVAVGVSNLAQAAEILAAGLSARNDAPLDILLCENQHQAAAQMRGLLETQLGHPIARQVGLVETVIGRMVPQRTEAIRAEDPLLIVAEPFKELPIARSMLRGSTPALPGLILADDFASYEARKLYLHNMSHAALAYLGYQRGYEYLWQCAADERVASQCRLALDATSQALALRSCFSQNGLEDYSGDLMRRFSNKALGDTVARIAADPLRKLRPHDRLIGAVSLCAAAGVNTEALAPIIAAALRYGAATDAEAVSLQSRLLAEGGVAVLHSLCGIAPDTELSRRIAALL